MSQLEVDKIVPQSGTTLTIGDSGDTVTFADGTSIGIDTNTLYIDSTNNRVGIGTSSPDAPLTVKEVSNVAISVIKSTGEDILHIGEYNGDGIATYNSILNGAHIFLDNGTEHMRINGVGNVLVGKTAINTGVAGCEMRNDGLGAFTRTNSSALIVSRLSSDGTIQEFRKDGVVIGSIGAISGLLSVGSGDTGIKFWSAGDAVAPSNPDSSHANRDASIDIGTTSNRFKDLYLSGGLYVGGTTAANKLDDYEEGTWTPVYEGATSNPTITYDGFTHGVYNKVGNVVFARGYIRTDGVSGGSGNLKLAGFPFNFPAQAYGATVLIQQILSWGTAPAFTAADNNADTVNLLDSSGNNLTTSDLSASSNSNSMTILAVYQI